MVSSNVLISHFDHVFSQEDRAKVKCGCPSSQKENACSGRNFCGSSKIQGKSFEFINSWASVNPAQPAPTMAVGKYSTSEVSIKI